MFCDLFDLIVQYMAMEECSKDWVRTKGIKNMQNRCVK